MTIGQIVLILWIILNIFGMFRFDQYMKKKEEWDLEVRILMHFHIIPAFILITGLLFK